MESPLTFEVIIDEHTDVQQSISSALEKIRATEKTDVSLDIKIKSSSEPSEKPFELVNINIFDIHKENFKLTIRYFIADKRRFRIIVNFSKVPMIEDFVFVNVHGGRKDAELYLISDVERTTVKSFVLSEYNTVYSEFILFEHISFGFLSMRKDYLKKMIQRIRSSFKEITVSFRSIESRSRFLEEIREEGDLSSFKVRLDDEQLDVQSKKIYFFFVTIENK